VARIEGAFVDALADRDVHPAVAALLELDALIERRVGAGDESSDLHAARATFRSLIVRLGDVATTGTSDPRESIAPFVETLLELRARARGSHDWSTADVVRDRLTAAGIEVHDDPVASTWSIREGDRS
jgi:cysteinyl-tRNA synthetase